MNSFTTGQDYIGFSLTRKERHVNFLQKLQNYREQFQTNLFLFSPVILGCGIGFYFSLKFEPNLFVVGFLAVISIIAFVTSYFKRHEYGNLYLGLYFISMILCGVFLGTFRTASLDTIMLSQDLKFAQIGGEVVALEDGQTGKGKKVLIKTYQLEDLPKSETPEQIRLTILKADKLSLGDNISVFASLHAPSAPVLPNGYSFRRKNYFENIGAIGFSYSQPKILEKSKERGLFSYLQEKRTSLSQTVREYLDEETAPVTSALLTGQRKSISEDDWENLRQSGLAHMLAISGLHVGLFAGTVFFFLRMLMALYPPLVLNFPIKKIAAIFAILAAAFYTIFVGASVPAVRALIMAGLIFTAIIFDRSPISLRLVSVAALLVLIFKPESLVSISFQMSFAAVMALVLFYDSLRPYLSQWYSHASFFRKFGLYVAGVCATTVVATIATAPFSLYHFQTLPLYGLIANVTAVPVLSFIVMPAAVLTFVLSAVNLEFISLNIMSKGVEFILWVAREVASLPNSVFHVSSMGLLSLFSLLISVTVLFTVKRWNKLWSLGFVVTAIIFALLYPKPNILLASSGKLLGVYDDGKFIVSDKRSERFARELWVQSLNIRESDILKFTKAGCSEKICCDNDACSIDDKIIYLKNRYPVSEYCQDNSKIIISKGFSLSSYNACKANIIDRYTLKGQGAFAFYKKSEGYKIQSVMDVEGNRPWSLNIGE